MKLRERVTRRLLGFAINNWLTQNILKATSGKFAYQSFYENLYGYSLLGMNLGNGGQPAEDGEILVIQCVGERLKDRQVQVPYIMFDVGANQGEWTQYALDQLDQRVKVFAFEPSAETFRKLAHKFGGNSNVELNNFGFSDHNGRLKLYSDAAYSGLASVYQRKLDHFGIQMGLEEEVEVQTLDEFCLAKKIEHVHLLKLDVEGHEPSILQGARRMLDAGQIDYIQFEFGGCNIDSRTFFQDFFYLLKERFRLFRILKDGLYPLTGYQETYEVFVTANYLAERLA